MTREHDAGSIPVIVDGANDIFKRHRELFKLALSKSDKRFPTRLRPCELIMLFQLTTSGQTCILTCNISDEQS